MTLLLYLFLPLARIFQLYQVPNLLQRNPPIIVPLLTIETPLLQPELALAAEIIIVNIISRNLL
jgi:hypothetical protein